MGFGVCGGKWNGGMLGRPSERDDGQIWIELMA
jgi:hypothetical protein